ncbi:MAG: segregation/condensation protein A [Oscillospiraceae bacterium]|nr:segregation/condensation protein A [Oscillospiraceae bacterium]
MEEPKYHLTAVVKSRAENLEDFDGPLDIILQLLSKNKIEIRDIQISLIVEQYLAYLEARKRMDLDIASEFVTMASHLIYIKSKMLLSAADQQEALSEMELLMKSLEERKCKHALEQIQIGKTYLAARNEIGLGLFPKQPEPLRKDERYRYQHDARDLLKAFAMIAARSEKLLPPPVSSFEGIVGKEPFPVTKKAAQLLKSLVSRGVQKFREMFRGNRSRSELVATFLAVLELCKLKSVFVEQAESGEQTVTFLKMPDETKMEEQT